MHRHEARRGFLMGRSAARPWHHQRCRNDPVRLVSPRSEPSSAVESGDDERWRGATEQLLEVGHQALSRGAWEEARESFEAAIRDRESPEALEGLS